MIATAAITVAAVVVTTGGQVTRIAVITHNRIPMDPPRTMGAEAHLILIIIVATMVAEAVVAAAPAPAAVAVAVAVVRIRTRLTAMTHTAGLDHTVRMVGMARTIDEVKRIYFFFQ